MIFIISPAKTMDFESKVKFDFATKPLFENQVIELIENCRNLEIEDIKKLMSVSSKLAELNFARFQNFGKNSNPKKQALFCYDGDVYDAIERESYNSSDIEFSQKHLRIISGLYGILKPMDMIEPYRLEMGIKLKNSLGRDLYRFWSNKVTEELNNEITISKNKYLYNLASNEYSDVIDRKNFNGKIIDINFKELRNGEYKTIPINSKRARGVFANYIIKNKIEDIKDIKEFSEMGYFYNNQLSQEYSLVFVKSN